MTSRTEFRVVVERDGQQWPLPNQHDEPISDRGAAEAYRKWVIGEGDGTGRPVPSYGAPLGFDRVFVVHRQVTETGWEADDGTPWDEQAARDGVILARHAAEGHGENGPESNAAASVGSTWYPANPQNVTEAHGATQSVGGAA